MFAPYVHAEYPPLPLPGCLSSPPCTLVLLSLLVSGRLAWKHRFLRSRLWSSWRVLLLLAFSRKLLTASLDWRSQIMEDEPLTSAFLFRLSQWTWHHPWLSLSERISSWLNLCTCLCVYQTWVCSLFLSGLWVILFVSQCLFPPHFMSRYGITHVFNHFNSHEGKITSCFNLYFFDYYWVWTSVHMLIGHLHISVNCLLIFFAHFSFGWSLFFFDSRYEWNIFS